MSHPYVYAALARDRQNMLLAEADAVRLAKQARTRHHQRGTPSSRRSPLRWTPAWLPWAWSRLLTPWAESASVASGSRAVPYDRSAMADEKATQPCCEPGARSVPSMMAKGGVRAMMPYDAYRLYQIQRTKSPAEIRHADEQAARIASVLAALSDIITRRQRIPANGKLAQCRVLGDECLPAYTTRPSFSRNDVAFATCAGARGTGEGAHG